MIAFLIQRFLQACGLMMSVALIAFVMFQFVGDPVDGMLPENATQIERDELRNKLGLNDSVLTQYTRFVGNIAQGNFGISYYNQSDVFSLIAERLPATLELVFVAVVMSLAIGIPLGVWVTFSKNRVMTSLVQTLSLVGVSLPSFVVGILLIIVFSVWLGWFPSHGRGEITEIGGWSTGLLTVTGWQSIILPAMSLALFMITMVMRLLKSEMQETLRADYIKFAKARGIKQRSIRYKHVLKNSLLPVITVVGLQIGGLIAFAVVTETIFQWPGMGLLFIQAVNYVDIPVISAYLVFISLIFVTINTVVDIIYQFVDPRMRAK
ncbi:ABC transporter permease [Photobacterium ganghwense]|uniref:ABC transporter permease n=1 Tax=Photobacterium ganghwense TaxID=320778 RepID=A0A0J1K1C4_9GAMM|nr:ABC transporter permease [Photobacterium ganghwense]KLV08242.1 ABC transporter permease [Photobacterium ganghwense]PSU07372.1 ABC transporter permease [Photobacterium ganghwense]QSV16109.1 ABC transporter permease [Photobacterium ganghwense]